MLCEKVRIFYDVLFPLLYDAYQLIIRKKNNRFITENMIDLLDGYVYDSKLQDERQGIDFMFEFYKRQFKRHNIINTIPKKMDVNVKRVHATHQSGS
jgi:hypothetical protein